MLGVPKVGLGFLNFILERFLGFKMSNFKMGLWAGKNSHCNNFNVTAQSQFLLIVSPSVFVDMLFHLHCKVNKIIDLNKIIINLVLHVCMDTI